MTRAEKAAAEQAATEVEETKEPEMIPSKWDPHELVEIELFDDGEKYTGIVDVAVGGKNWRIERGIPVKIPRYVYQAWMDSQRQDKYTARLKNQKSKEFTSKFPEQ